ncbi:hypothetical protein Slin14017_G117470 [Septoria linicola]|nr:hypothetical protein Slin14017_G117470 [Septoria linicola]
MARVSARCALLELPVELRLEIYAFAVLDCKYVTIGTAKIEGSLPNVVHRLYGRQRAPYPGIPERSEPVVEAHYRAALLSVVKPATVQAEIEPAETAYAHTNTAYHTLSLLNKQINEELQSHFAIPTRRDTSLFVQYPFGLHILHDTTPQLLRQARTVHLAGSYTPQNYSPSQAARLGPQQAPEQLKLQGNVVPDSERQLERLFKSCFGARPSQRLQAIELRVYYPGHDAYSTVWGDDESPIVIALRNIALGEISIEVWRGQYGTGVVLSAVPTTEKKRVVSTVWRKLEEGREDQPEKGSWIVDPQWPDSKVADGSASSTRADTVISTHA